MPTPEQIAEANYRAELLADTIAGGAAPTSFIDTARTGRLSPPVRQTGQMYAPNGVRVGTMYNQPVNESAQAVVGGYSPYGTVLYAPPRRNRFLEMQAMFDAFRPDPAMMQQIFMQALRQPIRGGGAPRGGGSKQQTPKVGQSTNNAAANATTPAQEEKKYGPVNYKPMPGMVGGPTGSKVGNDFMPINPDLDYNFDAGNRGIFQDRQGSTAATGINSQAPTKSAADANWDATMEAIKAALAGDKDTAADILARNSLRYVPPMSGLALRGAAPVVGELVQSIPPKLAGGQTFAGIGTRSTLPQIGFSFRPQYAGPSYGTIKMPANMSSGPTMYGVPGTFTRGTISPVLPSTVTRRPAHRLNLYEMKGM